VSEVVRKQSKIDDILGFVQGLKVGMWNKRHHLNKMTFRQLCVAYIQYYAIQAYLLLSVVAGVVAYVYPTTLVRGAIAGVFAVAAYPLVWYCLHRWVLHSRWMFKSSLTAAVWKRIHYDHHQDPHHLEVLFGALYTTLPAIVAATVPVGFLIGGIGGAAIALCAGLLTTCFYEFCHCIQHLSYKPRANWLAVMKARHMAHHFHDETGNFGITNFLFDKIFGSFYEREARPVKSETVFNLGYTPEKAAAFPWVANMSGGKANMERPRDLRKAVASMPAADMANAA
jgi:sterol desaturase/sphingolipid hydroxylase (fatty acid hydroxylase superfamily)